MYDVIIIGSGPAGLMSAIKASEKAKVLLIEKNAKPAKKLMITGGGRCNVTNLKTNQEFLDAVDYNKKYLYSAISKFGPSDIREFFEKNGVPLKEESDNKLFPVSNKSKDIIDALLNNCIKVDFKYNEAVQEIESGELKTVTTDKEVYRAKKIIIATGGVSFSYTGSSGDHLTFAKKMNQPVIDVFPAETSVILNKPLDFLAGTAISEVIVKYLKKQTRGNLMFTHKGISGSAIMQMSEHIYLNDEKRLYIDLIPNISKEELFEMIFQLVGKNIVELNYLLDKYFSHRFTDYINRELSFNRQTISKKCVKIIVDYLKNMPFIVKEVENIDKAYVTGGGIDLNYIFTTTMESKINPGIYFVGEALDIHGPIGGYNITLALSTGYLAGISVTQDI